MNIETPSLSSEYQTLWPGGSIAVPIFNPALRPKSLDGATVAFVWDYVFRGDDIFPILQEALSEAYPSMTFVNYDTFGNTFGGDEHGVRAKLPELLAANKIDVAISGVGCCGACTPAVMRASAAIERAGVPTASLVCEGFVAQAHAISPGLGCAALPVAMLRGHVDSQTGEELKAAVLEHTLPMVIKCLTEVPVAQGAGAEDYDPLEIVAAGSFEEINEVYYAKDWSDGFPIVPPTLKEVEQFLKYTPDEPHKQIGVIQPSGSAVTIWNIAVNGVMAGCKPQEMPILVAIAEVLSAPEYGVEHSGDTTGGDALIILNGPILKQLGYNCENGAMRDGNRANNTTGRFLRLFIRNVGGLRPGAADKCTFGHPTRIALVEHEDEVNKLGWQSFAQTRGFEADTNLVTVGRFTGDTVVGSVYGSDPAAIAEYIADGLIRQSGWELIFTVGLAPGTHRPLVAISPMIAKTLQKAGVDRSGLQHLLFQQARMSAQKMEKFVGSYTNLVPGRRTLNQLHAAGLASSQFAISEDPERLVPIVERPEDILVVVSGDPYRSNSIVFGSNGIHGFPTSREVRLT